MLEKTKMDYTLQNHTNLLALYLESLFLIFSSTWLSNPAADLSFFPCCLDSSLFLTMGFRDLGRDGCCNEGNEIVDLFCILIDWMPQSAVTLYIYRVGGLAPQEILLQDLNL